MGKRKINPKKASRSVGLKIRKLREERGWSLEKCEEMGWPDWTHLQKIELGKNMTFQTLINIANLFGVHPTVLLEDL